MSLTPRRRYRKVPGQVSQREEDVMKSALKIGVLSAVAALWLAGTALAQGTEEPATEQMLAEFERGNGNGILDEDIDSLTPEQMIDRAEGRLGAMRVTLESTTELLSRARQEERDILKINCINENLASIKGFVNVGEQSYESLTQSAEVNDVEAAQHHYTLISIAGQRVTNLGEQARVCAGEELRYAEDAVLEVQVDPDIGDPDQDFMDDDDVLDRLPEKSPHH